MWPVTVAVIVLSVLHIILGVSSICVGMVSSVQADVWLAHCLSPIWSGACVSTLTLNPFKPEITIVIFLHYKPRIAVAILDL